MSPIDSRLVHLRLRCSIHAFAFVVLAAAALLAQQASLPASSGDVAVRGRSLAALRQQMSTDPRSATTEFHKSRILDTMLADGQHADVANLSLQCINAQPDRTDRVEYFLNLHIRALLGMKNNAAALEAAKSYYNVCSITDTRKAMDLVAECLAAVYPDQHALVKRFKLQQLSGGGPTTRPVNDPLGESVLASIKIDGSIYTGDGLQEVRNPGWHGLGEANLFLLQDNPKEARKRLELVLLTNTPAAVDAAKVGIARAIKAADGHVHHANEYLRTLAASPPTSAPAP